MRLPINRYRVLLANYLLPLWRKAALLTALLFAGIGLQLAGPLVVRSFIDTATTHGASSTLTTTAALYLLIAVVTQAVTIGETYVAEDLAWTATNQLRCDAAAHCLRLDMTFHHLHTPGELIERIDGDAELLANFLSRFVIAVLGNALLLLGVLAVLFRIDWRVGTALLLYSICGLLALGRVRGFALPHFTVFRQLFSEMFGFLEEWLSGTEDARANGATAYPLRLLSERFRAYLRPQRTAMVFIRAVEALADLLLAVGTVIAFLLTAYLFTHHAITVGTAYLIFSYSQQLVQPLRQISGQLDDAQQATAGMLRLEALLATQPDVPDGPGASLPAGALAVAFEQVDFAYEGKPVLHEISFGLEPGRILGLVGRTGSGKTTLARLLFRLYDPSAGTISLGGIDLRALRLADLRSRVGLVTQDVQLFQASVRDNLTFFATTVSDTRILAAIEELGLLPWYQTLPHGLDTGIAHGGTDLSAGQAQLLALVRAFLADPSLVLLDEASSRLDPASERQLDHAISRLLAGRTGMIIAHRLSTLHRADAILVLEQGRIVEHGLREQLAGDPSSRYAYLLRTHDDALLGEPQAVPS